MTFPTYAWKTWHFIILYRLLWSTGLNLTGAGCTWAAKTYLRLPSSKPNTLIRNKPVPKRTAGYIRLTKPFLLA